METQFKNTDELLNFFKEQEYHLLHNVLLDIYNNREHQNLKNNYFKKAILNNNRFEIDFNFYNYKNIVLSIYYKKYNKTYRLDIYGIKYIKNKNKDTPIIYFKTSKTNNKKYNEQKTQWNKIFKYNTETINLCDGELSKLTNTIKKLFEYVLNKPKKIKPKKIDKQLSYLEKQRFEYDLMDSHQFKLKLQQKENKYKQIINYNWEKRTLRKMEILLEKTLKHTKYLLSQKSNTK